jgi:hypothetical protein
MEETVEEKLSPRSPVTNATSCQECGLSELRRSRSLIMNANYITVREGKTKSYSRVSDGSVEVRKGTE